MWVEIKQFLYDLIDVFGAMFSKLWAALKWMGILLATFVVWSWNMVSVFFLIAVDLAANHLYALLVIFPVIIIGFFITNNLQKKKGFTTISWYQNPKVLTVLIFPLILSVLGLVVFDGPISISQSRTNGLFPALGQPGHLGLPTTIWAFLISFVFMMLVGIIALNQMKKRSPAIGSDEDGIKEEKIPQIVDGGDTGEVEKTAQVAEDEEDEGEVEKTTDDYIADVIKSIDNLSKEEKASQKKS